MSKSFTVKSIRGNILRASAFNIESISSAPCIIIAHGFKGFKDWGFFPYTAEYLAANGYFVLTFNFSHNGIGENLLEFTELEKFAENTYSLEVEELNEIIDNYKNGFFGKTNGNKIGLIGHSRGGGVSVLTASKRNDVNALVTWASISTVDRYTKQQKERWRKDRFMPVQNARTKQEMNMSLTVLEDIENNKDNTLNIEKAASGLKCPFLIIHGNQDLSVKISEAESLYKWSDKSKTEFVRIPFTGHTFDAVHPFERTNAKLDKVLDYTKFFFNKYLI